MVLHDRHSKSVDVLIAAASVVLLGLCVHTSFKSIALKQKAIAEGSATQLYADASSPLYLEPYRHQDVDEVAWKWAAHVRAQRSKEAKVKKQEKTAAAKDLVSEELAQVQSPASKPCPWYGCADGSHANFSPTENHVSTPSLRSSHSPCPWYGCPDGSNADFSDHSTKVKSHTNILSAQTSVTEKSASVVHPKVEPSTKSTKVILNPEKATSKPEKVTLVPKAQDAKNTKLLAHGFGTSNIISDAGKPALSLPSAAESNPSYDHDHPTSFDEIPLADAHSKETRIALHQPAGDGALLQNMYRFQTLSGWRSYEHGLSQCMQVAC
mmetsp:Transcript_80768/g.216569  ORF Transcript_80768/g.216569 Transcript_80768/m.216569 type:complete len:324 (+) Transcript_80768:19-990(+)